MKFDNVKLKYRVDFYNYVLEVETFDPKEGVYKATWLEEDYLETQYFIDKEAALSKCFEPLEERVRRVVIGKYKGPELIE